ncbi:hypothetical protein J7L67_05735 [bacterium]|nr:hypothetical protein [bacterium]
MMTNIKYITAVFFIYCLFFNISGCAKKAQVKSDSKEYVLGENVVDGTIGAVTQTTEFARLITENTGSLTENFISVLSEAIKQVIVSLENLRKKSIETFGQKSVTEEVTGPAFIECPYCKKSLQIKTVPKKSSQDRYQCPFCKKEFIVKWGNQ